MIRAYVRKLATIASGGALGQVGAVLASPILSRVFTPTDYGVSGVVLSISMMMVFISTLRYEQVIVAGRTMTSRRSAVGLSLLLLVTSSALLLAGLLLVEVVRRLFGAEAASPLYLFAPLILLLSVVQYRVLPPFLILFERYALVSLGNFVNGAGGALAQIGLGFAGFGALGLLLGRSVGLVVAIACMALPVMRRIVVPVVGTARRQHLRRVFCAYRDQAYFMAPAGFMNTATMQLPIFVVAPVFGPAAAGAYFFSQGLANAALTVYRQSITSLTAKEVRELQRLGRPVLPFMVRVIGAVAVLTLSIAVVLFLQAERIVPFIFGDQWDQAGTVVKWLGFYYAAAAIHLPATALATLLRFQRNMLVTQSANFVATGVALAIGVRIGDFEIMVALVTLAMVSVSLLHLGSMLFRIRRHDRQGGFKPDIKRPGAVDPE